MTDVPARFTTLAILAGGEGRRMGKPKSLLTLDGQPILAWLLDRLAWPGPTLLVTAPGRERPPGHERFDDEATDTIAADGPLRGLKTALDAATTSLLVVAPLDMPNLDSAVLRVMIDRLSAQPARVGLMLSHDDRLQPLPAAFRVEPARAMIDGLLRAGVRSLHALADDPAISVEACPDDVPATTWLNLNRPADLDEFVAGSARGPANEAPRV